MRLRPCVNLCALSLSFQLRQTDSPYGMAAYLQRLRIPAAIQALLAEGGGGGTKKKIVIDYSSPNIAKQFHIGNLRSTLIGAYLDRVHRALGHDVLSVNYLGDWGTQFALIATYWPQVRPSEQYWKSLNDVEKIRSLSDCYVVATRKAADDPHFQTLVKSTYVSMENSILKQDYDSEAMLLWKDIRTISERHLKGFYQLLNIHFDKWLCESELVTKAHGIADKLIKDNTLRKTDDGLFVMDHPSTGKKATYSILKKSDNTSLYLTREIASLIERDQVFGADRYLYVVDKAQKQHFTALKIILDRMGRSDLAAKVEHVPFGRVKGLSTRRGRTEVVGEIIKNGTEQALEFMNNSKTIKVAEKDKDEVAKQLAISTIIFNDVKRARCSEYEFSFQNAFALNHNNALLLQAKHSRVFSIETRNSEILNRLSECNSVPQDTREVLQLIKMLERFASVVSTSVEYLEACQLTLYLIQLSQCIGTVAAQLHVKDQPEEVAAPRLLLLSAARNVLANGMHLLGMDPVNRM